MTTWESLGGTLASAPAVATWAPDEMQVFAIFGDGQLWNRYWDGAAWHAWESLGGELIGDPAACSWGAERIDLFARGRDGALWHAWYEPAGWQPWESLGGDLASNPAACSGPQPPGCLRPRGRWRPAARLVGRQRVVLGSLRSPRLRRAAPPPG